jgi:nucleotide-binding universal stress UspA family protein
MLKIIKKILVPLDDSIASLRALDLAISISKGNDSTITGMHVIRMPIESSSKITQQYRQNASKIINAAMRITKKAGVPFKEKIKLHGYIGNEIVKFAQDNKFDLIVMGSRGPHPIDEIFLGSVANYVVTKSKIPILIVK